MVSAKYLAGFVDGEGSLSLARRNRRNRSPEYSVRVALYNCDRGILEDIRRSWGGYLATVGSRFPGWRVSFSLIWTNAAAVRFLTRVKPFLRIKATRATALLEFHEHVRSLSRRRDPRGRLLSLSKKEKSTRREFHARLRSMNRRGRSHRAQGNERGISQIARRDPSAQYLAGFLDGEGCLMIAKFSGPSPGRVYYRARVAVDNSDQTVLKDLQRLYGGILARQAARQVGWSDVYKLIWTGDRVEKLVRSVLPHLRVKRKQGILLLRFIRHRVKTRQRRIGNTFTPLSGPVVAAREEFCRRMHELNARGSR